MKRNRQLIVISGSISDCFLIAKEFTAQLDALWLSDNAPADQSVLTMRKATTVLGQEYQAIVFDAHHAKGIAFDANAFGAIIGTIIAGGYLVLLTPDLAQWGANSRFLQRFTRLLTAFDAPCYSKNKTPIPASKINPAKIEDNTLNNEQQIVFKAMLRVVYGHRRRPLVLSSDRGRGKSTLLGKLAAYLLQEQIGHIIITAPSRRAVETLFNAARIALKANNAPKNLLQNLHFFSPDKLQRNKPTTDLLLVDEAASIPLSLLKSLTQHYSRLIFATTEHGYEGSGRGFAIRFRQLLDTLSPQWQQAQLKQPFRWAINDPLEQFSFDALLLNADSPPTPLLDHKTPLTKTTFERIHQQALSHNEALLRQIFALLVNAHYQTRPSDLVRLLDDPCYQIFILHYQQHLIATAIIVQEGGIDQELATAIYNGKRRPQGHLIPQLLATQVGIKESPCYRCDRVMRIAVQPQQQKQGFGHYFLKHLIQYSKQQNNVDYIATSFGATPKLINFWNRSNFKIVQISMKRDASSGTHSIIMLHPFSSQARFLYSTAQNNFKQALPLLLADPLRHLEAPLVAILFQQIAKTRLVLNKIERDALNGFCNQQRGYESSLVAIYKLTLFYLSQPPTSLTSDELQILIAKVLQKYNYASLANIAHVTGKKEAIKLLRQAVKKAYSVGSD